MPEPARALAEQFDDLSQQREACELGMWTFLATEVLFFGGLFLAYIVYRGEYPQEFAEASRRTELVLGTLNTAILLTSSLTMALAVQAARAFQTRQLVVRLTLTVLLGSIFLAVKGFEYHKEISEHLLPGAHYSLAGSKRGEIFFYLYFAMTGLHALHVLAGICLLSGMAVLALRRRFTSVYYHPVEISGLYWHFVDIVWVFLYPLIYLIGLR